MQKILLGTAALLALGIGSANAQSYIENSNQGNVTGYNDSPLSGAYIGAYGGYGWTDVGVTPGSDIDAKGTDYGVFLGYSMDEYLQRNIGINGAVEAHFGWSDQDGTSAGVGADKKNEWGVSFRPGISISQQFNPYGIIGYRNAKFDVGGSSERHDGFELGFGSQLVSMGGVGIRADYTHVWYTADGGIDPEEDNIRLGLAYHF